MGKYGHGYQDIADDLRAKIRRGDHAPGVTLPKQIELAQQWGVNINTVRRAVQQLQAEGLVTPVQGHGTTVRDLNPVRLPMTRYVHPTPGAGPFGTACALMGLTGVVEVTGVSRRRADPVVAQELDIDAGSNVCCRTNRMRITAPAARARVVQLQTTWLPGWVAQGTPLAMPDIIPGGIYRGLQETGHVLGRAVEVVSVRMPTREESRGLDLRPGSPVADVRRTTTNRDGRPIVHTHLVVTEHVCLVYPQEL